MTIIEQFKYIIFITSLGSSFSTYHQVYLICYNKSAKNISLINISFVFTNMVSHLIYSFMINDINIIVTFANSTLSVFCFLFSIIYYRYIYNNNRLIINEV